MAYDADDFVAIARNRAANRKAEGLPDDNWQTAIGYELDACAAGYELYRETDESDWSLRKKIENRVEANRLKRPWFYG